MGLLSEFRKWLDAEEEEAQAIASDADLKPRNRAEEFLVKVAREVEKTMMAEMFTPPGGPTYIPKEYLVFLSESDDTEWRGEKRRGLEQGLYHVLSERASLIASEQPLQATSFAVDLRVDGSLEPGGIRVQAVWDSEATQTMVLARKSRSGAKGSTSGTAELRSQPDPDATMVRPRSSLEDSETTKVSPRKALYTVTVSRGGQQVEQRNIGKSVITIGRGSRTTKVDLPLTEDMEISRRQAVLKHEDGRITVTCEGVNSIFVDTQEVMQGESAEVAPGQKLVIGEYTLELSPPAPPPSA